jgi:LysM repeat protein
VAVALSSTNQSGTNYAAKSVGTNATIKRAGPGELASNRSTQEGVKSRGTPYKIQPGDTLSSIAAANGTTVEALASANNIKDVNVIVSGKTLTIPNQIESSEATPTPAQPGNTPKKGFNLPDLASDAYRYGNSSIDGADGKDPLVLPRVLGEEADKTASISISTQISGALQGSVDSDSLPTGDIIDSYSRFLLESVREAQLEKYQIVETFTAFYTFFYGKRPSIYSFSGTLLNDSNHKWTNDFMFFYENFFRGTRAVEMNSQALIAYDGRLVSGFILDINIMQNATLNKGAQFSMNVLITDHATLSYSTDIDSLIASAKQELLTRAQTINNQIASINHSIPTAASIETGKKLAGQSPMNSVTNPGKAVKGPVSKKKK